MKTLLGELPAGRYVVAVSGGVDSVSLLNMLSSQQHLELVVAHVNHGIREDSMKDLQLVRELAAQYNLPFYSLQVKLGAKASEDLAREVRYGFLFSLLQRLNYEAIITAHHQGDLLETSLLHMMRGTGRRGLAGFNEHEYIVRPLVKITKAQLIEYAQENNLLWREDSTNQDTSYKRNAVRQKLVPELEEQKPGFTDDWLQYATVAGVLNEDIEAALDELLEAQVTRQGDCQSFDRHWFVMLPHEVAREVLATVMRRAGVQDMTRKRIEQLTVRLKTGKINTRYDCDKRWEFRIEQTPYKQTRLNLALKQGEC